MIGFFKAICDSNRHQILQLLKNNGEMNATDIIEKIGLSQPTISHHLKILTEANVLETRKSGRETYYQINKKVVNSCCTNFAKDICSNHSSK